MPFSPEAQAVIRPLISDKELEVSLFPRYAQPRGIESATGTLLKRFCKVITDRKLTMHFLRHLIKDGLRNTCYLEAISMPILGHGSNTVVSK